MKKHIILTLSLIITFSCTKNDTNEKPINIDSFFGTWKLIQVRSAPNGWGNVSNFVSYTYTFNKDSSFSSTRFTKNTTECATGTYSYTTDSLTLIFGCDMSSAPQEPL